MEQTSTDQQLAHRILGLTWTEASRYGAAAVRLLVSEGGVRYDFRTSDDQLGEGEVNQRYGELLRTYLLNHSSVKLGSDELEVRAAQEGAAFLLARRSLETQPKLVVLHNTTAPTAESVESSVPKIPVAEAEHCAQKTILIVEDNPNFSRVLSRFLAQEGYRVMTCSDGAQALQLLQDNGDVVLLVTDRHMPRMSGDELISAVRRLAHYQNLPAILLTSDAGAEGVITALERGADLLLAKCEDPRVIRAYIRRFLARATAHN